MEREALPFALLAIGAGLFAVMRGAKWPHGRQLFASIVISLGLFVAPAILVYLSHEWVSAFTRVALFSLTPVFAVVFEPYVGGAGSQNRTGLAAALASVVGTLCVFPIDLPVSIQAGAAFAAVVLAAACVAVANCQAVRVASESQKIHLAPMAAVAGATAATGLVAVNALTEGLTWRWRVIGSDLAWSAAVTLPSLFLLFWLMRQLTAARMTTRFVLAPLMAILIGIAMDRPSIEPRTWIGLLLVAGGVGWLLFAPDDKPDANSSALNLNQD
ncbi:MAG TPA: DMT family transporter [Terracidiphilus sp.]|nr:DMT family transporter [Terracidiphilus sp.]